MLKRPIKSERNNTVTSDQSAGPKAQALLQILFLYKEYHHLYRNVR